LERKRERERPKKKIKGGSDDHVPVTVFPERRTPQNDEPKSKKKKEAKMGEQKLCASRHFVFPIRHYREGEKCFHQVFESNISSKLVKSEESK